MQDSSGSMTMTRLFLALPCAVMMAACGGGESTSTSAEDVDNASIAEHHDVHWGYEGEEGPDHWADLSEDYAACRDGTEQSPIDLTDAVAFEDSGIQQRLGDIVLTDEQRAKVADIVDNGHTIQVTTDLPMSLELGATVYELVQFHFHAPSEHTIDGVQAPLEAHFVHKSAAGELAVLGILIGEGEHNEVMVPIIAALPSSPDDPRHLENLDLPMNNLRQLPRAYYRYDGSLTTPPCSEGVRWIVAADLYEISDQQMAEMVPHLHDNFRPVQALGSRKIGYVSR
jgi:carbonic anhydrase